jgi:hypothetical protein
MPKVHPLSIVIRLADVTITRPDLEAALDSLLDRYEPTRGHSVHYAQIDVVEGTDYWAGALSLIGKLNGKIQPLLANQSIGTLSLDVALPFNDGTMSASAVIPSALAEAAGKLGADIEISIYRTERFIFAEHKA